MATLWQRSRSARAAGDIVTIDDYIGAVAEWGPYGRTPLGVTMTQNGQGTEPVPVDFAGMSAQMFGSNSVIFACMLARLSVFSQVRFQYQRIRAGRPGALFGDPSLSILEHPWVGGVTSDLLARMITDADLAGNAYVAVNQGEVVRLRPDWVDIVLVPREVALPGLDGLDAGVGTIGWKRLGYLYYEDGIRDDRGVPFLANQVCHFAPIPDPTATYRGMSWLTPVVRDVSADRAMTVHKDAFIRNSATPNMVIKHQPNVTPNMMRAFRDVMDVEYAGVGNAGKTMHIGGGADLTVVGRDFEQIDLRQVQGAGETRIAAAAGVPPIIVGLSEGLQAATYSNYGQARRRFADGTLHPLWTNAAGSLGQIRPAPGPDARLWYDARDIPFLREDSNDAAEIRFRDAQTIRSLVDGGFVPASAIAAVTAGDMSLLEHSGLLSVQLQPPGQVAGATAPPAPSTNGAASRIPLENAR
jgi:hypothetical protein